MKETRLARFVAFDIVARAAAGRIGRFRTRHGDAMTPTLLPVINPNIDLVTPREMKERFGADMVITNSYVIHKHDHLREQALGEGVHKTIGWDGPLMTDSGTFQMYVYGDVEVGPKEIVEFQANMGVDVATCLDLFVTPDMDRASAEEAVGTTIERTKLSADTLAAHRAAVHAGDKPLPAHEGTVLNTTVQGGVFTDLRRHCASEYRDLDAGYTTIGGVVPVMEQQMYPELVDMIIHSQSQLRKDRPVHLFGAGHPLVFPIATALGCDIFDSSSYAKYAKDGRVMVPEGTLHVHDLQEWPFASRFLDGWTPGELSKALKQKSRRKRVDGAAEGGVAAADDRIREREETDPRFAAERALAMHNLDVCFTDIRRIREAIRAGTLWELVEQRAAAHPMLAAATRRLREPEYQAWLEAREPLSGDKALRYTGGLSHHRPAFARIRDRMVSRYTPLAPPVESAVETPYAQEGEEKVEVAMHKEPRNKPYGAAIPGPLDVDQEHMVIGSLGPVPLGLDEAYPFAQSVLPRLDGLDPGHMGWVGQTKDHLLAAHDMMPGIPGPGLPGQDVDRDLLQVLRTADWQFGLGAGAVLSGLLDTTTVRQVLEAHPRADWAERNEAAAALSAAIRERVTDPMAKDRQGAAATLSVERSRKTRKMRTAALDGEHVLSLRAGDGLFTLKPAGAALLHAALPAPGIRVSVHADSVPFNRDGKSVFNQFVTGIDPGLRPGDECLVVDAEDQLIAVGHLMMAPDEIADFGHGMAVKVRDGLKA